MKKLKKFEEYMDDEWMKKNSFFNNDQLLQPENEEESTSENITPEQFEMMCNDAFMEDNINIIKNRLFNLKFKYVSVDRPDLKKIYMEAVRKWHIKYNNSLNM